MYILNMYDTWQFSFDDLPLQSDYLTIQFKEGKYPCYVLDNTLLLRMEVLLLSSFLEEMPRHTLKITMIYRWRTPRIIMTNTTN